MIQIGAAKSIGHGEDYNFEPDDRQELVKTVSGAVAIDPWEGTKRDAGDVIQVTALFDSANDALVTGYWANRTRVTVVLDDGSTITNARIIVRRIQMVEQFYRTHKRLTIEIWRV